jgi:MerR family copper efflux transcriptional regulator
MRIGELAAASGLTAKTLRFYEQTGLLPGPPRTPSGYRDYPAGTARRLRFIRDAQASGFTLAEIRGILDIHDTGEPPCEHVTELIDRHLTQVRRRIAELRATEEALCELAARASVTDPRGCAGGEICTIF